jgi:hypothetical protein
MNALKWLPWMLGYERMLETQSQPRLRRIGGQKDFARHPFSHAPIACPADGICL